eukprot:4245939-Amphidinium_carterae.1
MLLSASLGAPSLSACCQTWPLALPFSPMATARCHCCRTIYAFGSRTTLQHRSRCHAHTTIASPCCSPTMAFRKEIRLAVQSSPSAWPALCAGTLLTLWTPQRFAFVRSRHSWTPTCPLVHTPGPACSPAVCPSCADSVSGWPCGLWSRWRVC